MADIAQLIAGLRDFRTRSDSLREIAAAGESAVQPLVRALHTETQEGAQWAILRCLGEIKARDAVVHIVPMLEDRRCRTAAHEALIRIVGQDLGPTGDPWLNWVQTTGAAKEHEAGGTIMLQRMKGHGDERLIALAMKDSGGSYDSAGQGRYAVRVPVGDVQQPVVVHLSGKDHEGSPIAIVYADCGPAHPEHYEYALKRNFKTPYGALAVRETPKGLFFVMFNTILREALSPLELRKSIFTIAECAARVKREMEAKREPAAGES